MRRICCCSLVNKILEISYLNAANAHCDRRFRRSASTLLSTAQYKPTDIFKEQLKTNLFLLVFLPIFATYLAGCRDEGLFKYILSR